MKKIIKVSENNERKVDELGRIVIPITMRKKLNIQENDYLEMYKSGKNIILKKLEYNAKKNNLSNLNIIINNDIQLNIDINKIENNISKSKCNEAIVRTIDELGRVIIPKQLREELNIKERNILKLCEKDNMIILIKKEYDNNNSRKKNSNFNRK